MAESDTQLNHLPFHPLANWHPPGFSSGLSGQDQMPYHKQIEKSPLLGESMR
jgi:hypothetical protein